MNNFVEVWDQICNEFEILKILASSFISVRFKKQHWFYRLVRRGHLFDSKALLQLQIKFNIMIMDLLKYHSIHDKNLVRKPRLFRF